MSESSDPQEALEELQEMLTRAPASGAKVRSDTGVNPRHNNSDPGSESESEARARAPAMRKRGQSHQPKGMTQKTATKRQSERA